MKVIINRDSVCMGDDAVDHQKTYQMDNNATYEDLFNVLLEDRYFPQVYGNNVVWVLTSKKHECIFSYFSRTRKLMSRLSEKSLSKLAGNNGDLLTGLMLKYYTTPHAWKEKIYQIHHEDMDALQNDGWLAEIQYCDEVMSLGMEQNNHTKKQ